MCSRPSGGRAWWAPLEFTRINIELTIHKNQFEDLLEILETVRCAGGD
jgi:hypothetical protein